MSKINFPKKQEQRLIPKYLLEYAEELQENHPDPSASWGGGSGGSYTAGEGIIIENNEISVDSEDVAMVQNLATVAFSGSYSDLSNKPDLSVYELKEDAFTGDYNDLTNKPDLSVYELKADAFSGDYDDLTDKPDLSVYAETADLGDCAYLDEDELSIAYSQITGTPTIPTKTSDLTNDSGYITGVTWNDVTGKPTFATVATTGDYDDLLNKPTLFSGDYDDLTDKPDLSVYELKSEAFSGDYNDLTNKPTIPVVPTNVSAFTNDAGYITGITSSDVTTALGYTPGTSNFDGTYNSLTGTPDLSIYAQSANLATVATTGAYSDLSGTPTIPAAVSGTNDGTNWTTLTIGSDTYAIGGGSTPSNMMTTDTAQDITGVKTFVGDKLIKFKMASSTQKLGFTCYDNTNREIGYLESRIKSNVPMMSIGMYNTSRSDYDRQLRLSYQSNNGGITYNYNLVCPTRLQKSGGDAYFPVSFKATSATAVEADNTGAVDLTSVIEQVLRNHNLIS